MNTPQTSKKRPKARGGAASSAGSASTSRRKSIPRSKKKPINYSAFEKQLSKQRSNPSVEWARSCKKVYKEEIFNQFKADTFKDLKQKQRIRRRYDPYMMRKRFFNFMKTYIHLKKMRVPIELFTRVREALEKLNKTIPGWLRIWEILSHDANNGVCGTLDLSSLVKVCTIIALLISMSGLDPNSFCIIEVGCGVLDFAKALLIALPRVNVFGFELKNYYAGVFSNLIALTSAIRNLKDAVSTCHGVELKDIGAFEYSFGTGVGQNKFSLKTFLRGMGASEKIAKSHNKIVTCFWEGWNQVEKTVLLQAAASSGNAPIIFTGDKVSKFPTSEKLSILNDRMRSWKNEYVLFQRASVSLAGGGDTMSGCFFVQKRIFAKAYMEQTALRVPLCGPADMQKNKWFALWKKSASRCLNISLEAVALYITKGDNWLHCGMPSRWHVMNRCDVMNANELKEFASNAIAIYLNSPEFVPGGFKRSNRQLRTDTDGMSDHEKAKVSEARAKINMFAISAEEIANEFAAHVDTVAMYEHNESVYAKILEKTRRFGCAKCDDFVGTSEEIERHFLNSDCPGTLEEDLIYATTDINDFVFNDKGYQHLKTMFKSFEEKLSTSQQLQFTGAKAKQNIHEELCRIIEAEIQNYSEMNRKRELLNRWRAQVTVRQKMVVDRTNKHLVNWRFVGNCYHVPVGDVVHKIKMPNLSTKLDSATGRKMLEEAGIRDYIETMAGIPEDHAFIRHVGAIIKYRLRMIMMNRFRSKRFDPKDALYVSVHVDGAPRAKTGNQKGQFIVAIRILNEGFTVTQSSLIPLVIANIPEDGAAAQAICKAVGDGLVKFQEDVKQGELKEWLGIEEVRYIAACDLKALNSLYGFVDHKSTFCHPSKIWACKENSGYGLYGRLSGEMFKDYRSRQLSVEEFETALQNRIDTMDQYEADAKRHLEEHNKKMKRKHKGKKRKVGRSFTNAVPLNAPDLPRPVQMSDGILKFLRNKMAAIPETERESFSKKIGIGLKNVYPLFGDVTWFAISLCALHYKTTKVKDILMLACKNLAIYDEARGHRIADEMTLGPSLRQFLNLLSEGKFGSKLNVYAQNTEYMFIKTAGQANFAMLAPETKHLESMLSKEDKKSRRLIGEQANIVLSQMEEITKALQLARKEWKGNGTKKLEDGFKSAVTAIYCMGQYVKDVVYCMSLSTHPIAESREEKDARLKRISEQYRIAAKKLEYLQTFAFPDYFRPYDLVATCVGPDCMEKLVEHGFLMGEVGLLEVFESYHQYVKNLNVMKINKKNGAVNHSACVAKLIKIILIYTYGEIIDPILPEVETKKSYIHHRSGQVTKATKASYIKIVYEYDGRGCVCGRFETYANCEYCNYGSVEKIDKLVTECANVLVSQQKPRWERVQVTPNFVTKIHTRRRKLTAPMYMKGVRVGSL
jgi:hypothetical protein